MRSGLCTLRIRSCNSLLYLTKRAPNVKDGVVGVVSVRLFTGGVGGVGWGARVWWGV